MKVWIFGRWEAQKLAQSSEAPHFRLCQFRILEDPYWPPGLRIPEELARGGGSNRRASRQRWRLKQSGWSRRISRIRGSAGRCRAGQERLTHQRVLGRASESASRIARVKFPTVVEGLP